MSVSPSLMHQFFIAHLFDFSNSKKSCDSWFKCLMKLLTTAPFHYFITGYMEPKDQEFLKLCGIWDLSEYAVLIIVILLRHPRTPQLLALSFMSSRRCFHLFCDRLFVLIREPCHWEHALECSQYTSITHSDAAEFCIGFLASIKYWSKDLVEEFSQCYRHSISRSVLEALEHPTKSIEIGNCESEYYRLVTHGIGLIIKLKINSMIHGVVATMERFRRGCKKLHLQEMERQFVRDQCMILRIRKESRLRLCCSWAGCRMIQRELSEQLRVCGGCKMAYYCSRSCQKRAWPGHKATCLRFRSW